MSAPEQQTEVMQPQLLTVMEAAELLRVKPRTIHHWVSGERIPYLKAGRFTLFDRDELLAWMRTHRSENSDNVRPISR